MKRINLFIGVMLVLSVFTGCESNKQTNSSSSYNSEKRSQTKIETTVEKTTSAPDTQATTIQTEPTTEKPTEPPTEPPTEAPTEPPTEPPTEKPFSEYRTDITYDQLARTPDDYKNEDLVLRGKVIQVIEADFATQFRIAINDDYNCIIYALYEDKDTPRVLENDEITLYGCSLGLIDYSTVLGATITVPLIQIKMIENNTMQ